jgi:hypothetical protein
MGGEIEIGAEAGHSATEQGTRRMRRDWSSEDLIACWTMLGDDWEHLGNKTGATRLGFALLLK